MGKSAAFIGLGLNEIGASEWTALRKHSWRLILSAHGEQRVTRLHSPGNATVPASSSSCQRTHGGKPPWIDTRRTRQRLW